MNPKLGSKVQYSDVNIIVLLYKKNSILSSPVFSQMSVASIFTINLYISKHCYTFKVKFVGCGCGSNQQQGFTPSDVQGLEPPAWSYEPSPLSVSNFGSSNLKNIAPVVLIAVIIGAYLYLK